ncbi:hypothetical protein vseg_002066 [Gypsophila vaccaria]
MGNGNDENFLTVIAKNFDVLAGPLVALVYPLYASVKAIESGTRTDDHQWLTYWVLYSLITIFELSFAKILEWFPIWSYAKLFFTCWLVLPQFNGATHIYQSFIRPFYINPPQLMTTSPMWYVPKQNPFRKQDDVLSAAERYIQLNGPEAFERLLRKADREGKARRKQYTMYEDNNDLRVAKYSKTHAYY